jgi:hypothetical protein
MIRVSKLVEAVVVVQYWMHVILEQFDHKIRDNKTKDTLSFRGLLNPFDHLAQVPDIVHPFEYSTRDCELSSFGSIHQ